MVLHVNHGPVSSASRCGVGFYQKNDTEKRTSTYCSRAASIFALQMPISKQEQVYAKQFAQTGKYREPGQQVMVPQLESGLRGRFRLFILHTNNFQPTGTRCKPKCVFSVQTQSILTCPCFAGLEIRRPREGRSDRDDQRLSAYSTACLYLETHLVSYSDSVQQAADTTTLEPKQIECTT